MIVIIDYGMGNLRSVEKAFKYLNYDVIVTDDKDKIKKASHLVLPGVGAAEIAIKRLYTSSLDKAIYDFVDTGKPFLGICLGMQLMFDESYENGRHKCLGLVPGVVTRFSFNNKNLRIPHMGWNTIEHAEDQIFAKLKNKCHMYFVHSYHTNNVPSDMIIGKCDYGYKFVCAVRKNNLIGLQFHPEKSGMDGLQILKNFGGL